MHANNEVGHDPAASPRSRAIAREPASCSTPTPRRAVGKIPTRVDELGVDLLSIAGHKLYAPKGIGALYVRRGVRLEPLIHGAGHESGRRAGTESVLLVAALGEACEIAADLEPIGGDPRACATASGTASARSLRRWRRPQRPSDRAPPEHPQRLVRGPCREPTSWPRSTASPPRPDPPATPTRSSSRRCSLAMGVEPRVGMGAVRLSLGRMTTTQEIDAVLERFATAAGSELGVGRA